MWWKQSISASSQQIRIKRKGPEAQAEAGLTEASARCLDGGLKRRREEAAAAAVTEQSSLMDLVRRERATNARDSALEFTRLHMRAAMEEHFDSEMGENRGEEVKKRKKEKVGRGERWGSTWFFSFNRNRSGSICADYGSKSAYEQTSRILKLLYFGNAYETQR